MLILGLYYSWIYLDEYIMYPYLILNTYDIIHTVCIFARDLKI